MGEFLKVKFHCEKKYREQKCLAANSWEEIFGSKFFGFFFFFGGGGGGGGQNVNKFLFKANFLGRKFWGPSFGGEILVRRKFLQQKYFGGIFVSKISL